MSAGVLLLGLLVALLMLGPALCEFLFELVRHQLSEFAVQTSPVEQVAIAREVLPGYAFGYGMRAGMGYGMGPGMRSGGGGNR